MNLPSSHDELSPADQRAVADELAAVVAEMDERYTKTRHQGMFSGLSAAVQTLPDSGLEFYVDISALDCKAVIVAKRERTPGDVNTVLGEQALQYLRLAEPLVTPAKLSGPLPTPVQREDWLWAAAHAARIGQLGYAPEQQAA